MSRRFSRSGLTGIVAVALAACSDSTSPATTASLSAVSPAPAAIAVATSSTITLTFGRPMAAGMEHYVDLHQGGIGGSTVQMTCGWSPSRTSLTCTPANPLAAGTQYAIHVGGGMTDAEGHLCAMDNWPAQGGQWIGGGMMGGIHAGQPMGMMGSGWMHNGHYGMLFMFTTA